MGRVSVSLTVCLLLVYNTLANVPIMSIAIPKAHNRARDPGWTSEYFSTSSRTSPTDFASTSRRKRCTASATSTSQRSSTTERRGIHTNIPRMGLYKLRAALSAAKWGLTTYTITYKMWTVRNSDVYTVGRSKADTRICQLLSS